MMARVQHCLFSCCTCCALAGDLSSNITSAHHRSQFAPASAGLISACNLITGFELFQPAASCFSFIILSRTRVSGCSSPALWSLIPVWFGAAGGCDDCELAVGPSLLLHFLCVTMIRSPGFSSYLGVFKFSEKQGKARETESALLCIFYNIMNALYLPFYLVSSCIQLVMQFSQRTL